MHRKPLLWRVSVNIQIFVVLVYPPNTEYLFDRIENMRNIAETIARDRCATLTVTIKPHHIGAVRERP